jgi:hypothetical protein
VARVVLEQSFADPISEETYAQLAKRLDPCLEIRGGAWRRSYVSADRRRITCEFEAPDAEAVRQACRSAKVPFDRAWAAEVFAVEEYPEALAKLNQILGSKSEPADSGDQAQRPEVKR